MQLYETRKQSPDDVFQARRVHALSCPVRVISFHTMLYPLCVTISIVFHCRDALQSELDATESAAAAQAQEQNAFAAKLTASETERRSLAQRTTELTRALQQVQWQRTVLHLTLEN